MLPTTHQRISDILSFNNVEANIFKHKELSVDIKSPSDFARVIGYDIKRITKTVFVADRGASTEMRQNDPRKCFGAVCLSCCYKMNLHEVSLAFDWGGCEMAKPNELKEMLDYPPMGVSPIGLGDFRLIVDQSLLSFPTIIVGGGQVGVEVEIDPALLVSLTNCVTRNVIADNSITRTRL
jgi:Cys-tRNA(Pro)/Cys-tRNA(Cys) deacylase